MPKPSFDRVVPAGDDRERLTCQTCGFIAYENPRVIVGSVVTDGDGRILLCRRAIEPRRGFWTLPAGYLELDESVEAGAIREAREEAQATITIDRLLAVYSVVHIHQVQIFFRALLAEPSFSAGPESLEVELFEWNAIPWEDLAFPTVGWALRDFKEVEGRTDFAPFGNPSDDDGFDPVGRG